MKRILLAMISCLALLPTFSSAIAVSQSDAISDNCDTLRETLKSIQHEDSRARVYLGGHFETIFGSFVKPFNHRLIENNLINSDFVSSQTDYAEAKATFSDDFIKYQKSLENLLLIDCKAHPDDFYNGLITVRANRATVKSDTDKLKKLSRDHYALVQNLELKP